MKYYAAFTNNSWSESLGKTVTIKYWEEKEHTASQIAWFLLWIIWI